MVKTHFGQHGDDCFGCKVQAINIGRPSDMPTRKPQAVADKQYWDKREKDVSAYKRLRGEGLQVRGTVGAAKLEQTARTTFELESGQVAPTASISRRIEEANNEVKERMVEAKKESAGAE